jgi:pimeloyl-ACP methyl ester carboxylesterase
MLPTLWDLARDHRVLAPDFPGFGASEKPLRPFHPAFFARFARDFLDAVGVERAHVIGNSMGGRAAIELGLRFPSRVDRLVLLTPSPAWKRFRGAVPVVRVLMPELALVPLRIPRSRVKATIAWMFSKPERLPAAWHEAAVDEFLRVFRSPAGRVAFFSAARQIYLESPHGARGFWDRLPSLTPPTLFVWGDRDPLVPHRFAAHVADAVPGARSIVLPDCGHVPQFELPERTQALIREHLGAAPAPDVTRAS